MKGRPAGPPVLVGALVALLVSGLVSSTAPTVAGSAPARFSSNIQPFSQYDTGRVNVVFPSSLPAVELVQDANASVTASLQLMGVFELAPGGIPNPTVISAAFPSNANAFNGSTAAPSEHSSLNLTADLSVFPVGLPLWTNGVALGPTGAPVGSTTLTISYSATASSAKAAGVAVNWSVSGWPWATSQGSLALVFSFSFASGAALTACTGSTVLYLSAPPCTGTTIPSGSVTWGGAYSSFEGESGSGPVAVVSWGSTVNFGTAASPVEAGAYAQGAGFGQVLVGATDGGGSMARGTVRFALVAPVAVPNLSTALHGNAWAFAGALAGVATLAVAAMAGYRVYDRRVRERL